MAARKERPPTKAQLHKAAVLMAEAAAGKEKVARAIERDFRGRKAPKRRKKKKSAKGGQIPLHVLIKRYDSLGRLLKRRGFKE